ncbi:putative P53 regulated pa26 nuclear protein sestrin [Penaeus vannamei]|uniref:Putative P53 regulated pa26 nuclear protein sestrin n=1 Tax=Penaeus vannamei TaxID=6689 RepID=A0A423TY71_PENVA|nr:putative P53 regulated pa26 nuclear protein sestrin [Penaeus vannamei]
MISKRLRRQLVPAVAADVASGPHGRRCQARADAGGRRTDIIGNMRLWERAACRHNCSYLVEEQRQAFREAGGPEEWLVGLEYAPKKLQELHHTNLILAHQPWLYDIHHVEKLLKSCWSVSELTQAICILAQFHALSSYVHGCGIEVSSGELAACSSGSPSSVELSEGGVDVLVERMRSISLVQSDFNAISEEQTRDCSWEEHGFSLVSELYSEVADILDNKFKTAYNMTYYTCGHKTHVDTFLFRQAVWNYLHCLYGIRHDDYDYSQINQLLERNLKMFLKTVTCFPERLSSLEASPFIMKGFLNSEKVHVMVLVLEGRLQAELLHGLRALGHYLM